MENTSSSAAMRKARRFIAVLAAFALSFSLLGTASIEAFAATMAGDGEQTGNYAIESTSTDLVYDSVYGVRHGGYALMDKVTDASTGAHRLDLVRGSDNSVTWSKSFSGRDDEDLSIFEYSGQFKNGGFMVADDAGGSYVVDLNGNDLLNGARYDSIQYTDYSYVVGLRSASDGAITLTVYEVASASVKGSVTLPTGFSTDAYIGAWLGDDGALWLHASYFNADEERFIPINYRYVGGAFVETDEDPYDYDNDNSFTWPDGRTAIITGYEAPYTKISYTLEGGSTKVLCEVSESSEDSLVLRRIWGNDGLNLICIEDGSDYSYFDEEGNRVEWLDNYDVSDALSNGNYLVSSGSYDTGLDYYVVHEGADGKAVETSLDWTDSNGSKPRLYYHTGKLIYSNNPFGVIYDESGNFLGLTRNNLDDIGFHITAVNDETYIIDRADAFPGSNDGWIELLNYDGNEFSLTKKTDPLIMELRILDKNPIDGSLMFAADYGEASIEANMQVVDQSLNTVKYVFDDASYTAGICTESELADYGEGYADYGDFPNSAAHTSSSCNLMYVTEDGKYGAIDKDGNVVVPIEYDAYFDANTEDSNDTILVKKDGVWSFLKLGETETPSEEPSDNPTGDQPSEEPSGDQTGGEQGGDNTGDQTGTQTPEPAITTQTMYRLYNPNSGEHFYTANVAERDSIRAVGWLYEGVGWIAPTTGDPVYRLYNPNAGEHHYTTNASEKAMLERVGWNYEGVGWYSGGDVRLYREYNPNAYANNHNYTTNKGEHDWLLSLGWKDEGYAWNAVSAK